MANNSQPPGAQPIWPPTSGSLGSQSFASSLPMQYRPMVPAQQGQQYLSTVSQQFRPIGQGMTSSNVGMPGGPDMRPHFPHSMQQLPPRSSQPLHTPPMPYVQTNRPLPSSSTQLQQSNATFSGAVPSLTNAGPNGASSYTFVPSTYGQPQSNVNVPSQIPSISQMHVPVAPVAGQPWVPSGGQGASTTVVTQQTVQQPSIASPADGTALNSTQPSASDWQEHEAAHGRRYYYNRRTKQSCWEKPLELMTPIERADASTVWKEFTTSEGRTYYYNKITKQSVWSIPEEMKLARDQALRADRQEEGGPVAEVPSAVTEMAEATAAASSNSITSTFHVVASSPLPTIPVAPVPNATPVGISGPSSNPIASASTASNDVGDQAPAPPNPPTAFPGSSTVSSSIVNANSTLRGDSVPSQEVSNPEDGPFLQHIEEAKRGMAVAGKVNVTPLEEKPLDDEPFIYSSKQEAKNAFKALLESINVQSDWTWEQAMREIINDRRYGALKTLGERKQAFNEYLGQRKKLEAEERRMKQKKAREEFAKMLEESKELTSSVKWSKAVSMFENDERFKAVERNRDREDLYENYIVELARKEKEKAAEEHKHNIVEYRKYLESCAFIKVNSQWRKIVDRLEDDERCSRLEKIDRLLIFQDYIRDLEKEEEEQKKIQKEQTRRSERKNRDEFRRLLDDHVAAGILNAKTYWSDYCLKVKDAPEYQAVASNTSGSTPRDLFEDVVEDLENQYHEDKSRVKDAMKSGKMSMVSTLVFEDFKAAVMEDVGDPPISDINMKLVYEELLERAKEKEEKEAKKRQRLADDFTKLLYTFKELSASSSWEEFKPLVEESQEFISLADENFAGEIFEECITHLQEKAKEKEKKWEDEKARKEKDREEKDKRKEKERKERDKERERERGKEKSKKEESDSDTADVNDSYKEDKKKEKDKDRKHRKRHQSASDDVYSDKEGKDSKRSKRHSGDRKKSKKHAHSPESDSESRHKRHKRDRDSSRRNSGYEELEDGELGEDGEIQ